MIILSGEWVYLDFLLYKFFVLWIFQKCLEVVLLDWIRVNNLLWLVSDGGKVERDDKWRNNNVNLRTINW